MTILIVNDELGGAPAVSTPEALETVWADKGYRQLTDQEVAQHEVDQLVAQTPGIDKLSSSGSLEGLRKPELVALAESRELDTSGTADELRARLADSSDSPA